MDPWSYLIIALVCVTALAIGHFAGSDDPQERASLAIECGVRHPGLAIAIASANFSPAKALPVLVPCVFTVILYRDDLLVRHAAGWCRSHHSGARASVLTTRPREGAKAKSSPTTRWRNAPPVDGSDAPAG